MRFTKVRTHKRQDGSVVRAHGRRVNGPAPTSAASGLRGATFDLGDEKKPEQSVAYRLYGDGDRTAKGKLIQIARRMVQWEPREVRQYRPYAHEMSRRIPREHPNYGAFRSGKTEDATMHLFSSKSRVSAEGTGEVNWLIRGAASGEKVEYGTLFLHPEVDLRGRICEYPVVTPGANLQKAKMSSIAFRDKSVFDGADFRGADLLNATFEDGSFRHADLRGARLASANFSRCDLDGADLRDADVTGATFPKNLRGIKLTGKQFDSLAGDVFDGKGRYRVKEASMKDLVAAFGDDEDAMRVALWASDVEVRDRQTNEIVVGEFDISEHYVPEWELDRLA